MRRILGVIALLMGVGMVGFVCYNLFVQRLPETQGRSPIRGLFFGIVLIGVGVKWVRGETAG